MIQMIQRRVIRPTVLPIAVTGFTLVLIVIIGETLMRLFVPGRPEIERPELWAAVFFSLLILAVGALLTRGPRSESNPLDRELVVGKEPFFEEPAKLGPVDLSVKNGPRGTVADIKDGDVLYAQSGALARVAGVLPGGEEHGRRFAGYIYATGLYGASSELWIPLEAVLDVFPQTGAVFLAIKGDETETFGWNRAPEGFHRTPAAPKGPKGL